MTRIRPMLNAMGVAMNEATTSVEKVICSDARLTNLDDQLGRRYKDALVASSNSGALKAEQKAWLSSRDQCKDTPFPVLLLAGLKHLNAMDLPGALLGIKVACVVGEAHL